jgi:hypothetical protein
VLRKLRRYTKDRTHKSTECRAQRRDGMADTYIKVWVNLDSTMVTRLFKDNPIAI